MLGQMVWCSYPSSHSITRWDPYKSNTHINSNVKTEWQILLNLLISFSNYFKLHGIIFPSEPEKLKLFLYLKLTELSIFILVENKTIPVEVCAIKTHIRFIRFSKYILFDRIQHTKQLILAFPGVVFKYDESYSILS